MSTAASKLSSCESRRRRARQRGAALVEYAFTFIFSMTLFLGIMEFGHALYAYHFVNNAAKEVFIDMFATGEMPEVIVGRKGLKAETVNKALPQMFAGQGPLVFMSSPKPVDGGEATLAKAYAEVHASAIEAPTVMAASARFNAGQKRRRT